jgi:hypothetical protein
MELLSGGRATKRPWTSASLLDGLGLPPEDVRRIRPLLRAPRAKGQRSLESTAEAQRDHLESLADQLVAAANDAKKPYKRARHQDECKRALLVIFSFLSGGRDACSWDDCAAVSEPGLRFTFPLLPAQADAASAASDCFTRSWFGVEALRDVATKVSWGSCRDLSIGIAHGAPRAPARRRSRLDSRGSSWRPSKLHWRAEDQARRRPTPRASSPRGSPRCARLLM